MKKIPLVLSLVLLITAGIGCYAYAETTHSPINGSKIVGFAYFGGNSPSYSPVFSFINPNCAITITINQISIVSQDGSFVLDATPDSPLEGYYFEALGPHKAGSVAFGKALTGNFEELSDIGENAKLFTVEVGYSSDSAKGTKPLPLQGVVDTALIDSDGRIISINRANMVNY